MGGGFASPYAFSAAGALGPKIQSNAVQGFGSVAGYVSLIGWSVRETGGTAAVQITLRDSGLVTGKIIAEIAVPSGTSMWAHFGPEGIKVPVQLYAALAGTGTLSGVLYIR